MEEHNDAVRKAIERRAYNLYELDGFRDGNDLEHWLRAEHELTGQDSPLILENDAITIRLPMTEAIISIAPWSLLILTDAPDREVVRVISLPAEIDPQLVSGAIEAEEVTLTLPVSGAKTATQRAYPT